MCNANNYTKLAAEAERIGSVSLTSSFSYGFWVCRTSAAINVVCYAVNLNETTKWRIFPWIYKHQSTYWCAIYVRKWQRGREFGKGIKVRLRAFRRINIKSYEKLEELVQTIYIHIHTHISIHIYI